MASPLTRAKQLRLDRGITVQDAARTARVATKSLHKIEAGEEVAGLALHRLGQFYGVPASTLLGPPVFPEPDFPEAA